jgi:V-type H+-transporting ATPase subunit d
MPNDLTFNMDHGYLEGLVRGFKGGLLTQSDYANLVQCETLDGMLYFYILFFNCQPSTDLKLHLQSTDYGNFLANEPGTMSVAVIDERLKEKLVTEFTHMRNQALEPLATFLDYITLVSFTFIDCDFILLLFAVIRT